MRYKLLGRSGLRVSELCLGTLTFGTENGWGADREESRAMFEMFAEAGGNFLDTANIYTKGTSERFLGEFIAHDRGRFVVASKYSLSTTDGDPNASGNQRKNMRQALEASLKRLKTDYLDLLWVHAWDSMTPIDEVMRGLDDLVRAGKVLYVGISNSPAWIVSASNVLSELRGWTPYIGLQIEYNLALRDAERDLVPMARALDLGVTAWGALAFGLLTGKFNKAARGSSELGAGRISEVGAEPAPSLAGLDRARLLSDRNLRIAEEVSVIAAELGCSASRVALAWLRQHEPIVIPIVGARNTEQLADNLGCLAVSLSSTQLQRLDSLSRIELGFPHDFLANDKFRILTHGGTLHQTDNHRARRA